jgi:tetratricopeptide (TPR) repeat protein
MANKPREALGPLESVIARDPAHVRAFLYVGIIYQQLDRLEDAVAVYRKILPRAGGETARTAFNLGAVYFQMENFDYAEQFYSQAIEADPSFAPAYLNRGNLRVQQGELAAALGDYDSYLGLEPRSPKRPQIEQLCALIRSESAAAERRRIVAEEEAERERVRAEAEAEQRRIAAEEEAERERVRAEADAEQRRIAAEEEAERERIRAERRRIAAAEEAERERIRAEEAAARRQALLQEVSASLQSAAEEARGSSVGAEAVQGYEDEFELE